MIDSHAHLLPDFVKDIDRIVKNARSAGLRAIINSAIEPHHFENAMSLENANPNFIYTSLGFSASHIRRIDLQQSYELISNYASLVAIGEVGLDYHWIRDSFWRKKQSEAFSKFIHLANEKNKPIVIHSRKAESECIDILEKNVTVPVLMHCFAGTLEESRRIVDSGWLISIPTAVINRKKHRKIAKSISLEHLVVETDTPFLSPITGQKNEPANVKYAIQEIAKLKGTTFQEVDLVTTRNAEEFYHL